MAGNGALFAREDCIEATWAVLEQVLISHHPAIAYESGSWGPEEADELIATDGGWHTPTLVKVAR